MNIFLRIVLISSLPIFAINCANKQSRKIKKYQSNINVQNTAKNDIEDIVKKDIVNKVFVNTIVTKLSGESLILATQFEDIYEQRKDDYNPDKLGRILEKYIENDYTLKTGNNTINTVYKDILAPLVIRELHQNRKLPKNLHQLYTTPTLRESSEAMTYVNAYQITFDIESKEDNIYKKAYDLSNRILQNEGDQRRNRQEKVENIIAQRKKPQPKTIKKDRVPNDNSSPKKQINQVCIDTIETINKQICNHFNMSKDDEIRFAGLIDVFVNQYVEASAPLHRIYDVYVKNEFNLNYLLQYIKKDHYTSQTNNYTIKSIIGPLLLYAFLDENAYEELDHGSKNLLNIFYLQQDDLIPVTDDKDSDNIYKAIYINNADWQEIPIIKCRYEIALKNDNRYISKNNEDDRVLLQTAIDLNLVSHIRNFEWIDFQSINHKTLKEYLKSLNEHKRDSKAYQPFMEFMERNKDTVFTENSLPKYFNEVLLFFRISNKENFILEKQQLDALGQYLQHSASKEVIDDLLNVCQHKYPTIFAHIFITTFTFDWLLQIRKENRKDYFERLYFFNTLSYKVTKTICKEKINNIFKNENILILLKSLIEDKNNQIAHFIENNIKYTGKAVEHISSYPDNFPKEFLNACIHARFINKETKFVDTYLDDNLTDQKDKLLLSKSNYDNNNIEITNIKNDELNDKNNFISTILTSYQNEGMSKEALASCIAAFIPESSNNEIFFLDDNLNKKLCNIFGLNHDTVWPYEIRRAALKIGEAEIINKIYHHLINPSKNYDQGLHDSDKLYCALELCKEKDNTIDATRLSDFYKQICNSKNSKFITFNPSLNITNIINLNFITEEDLNNLKKAGIIDIDQDIIYQNQEIDHQEIDHQEKAVNNFEIIKKPFYKNTYLLLGSSGIFLGFLAFLVYKDFKNYSTRTKKTYNL